MGILEKPDPDRTRTLRKTGPWTLRKTGPWTFEKNRTLDLWEKPDPNIYTHYKLTNSPILIKFDTYTQIFMSNSFLLSFLNKFGQLNVLLGIFFLMDRLFTFFDTVCACAKNDRQKIKTTLLTVCIFACCLLYSGWKRCFSLSNLFRHGLYRYYTMNYTSG